MRKLVLIAALMLVPSFASAAGSKPSEEDKLFAELRKADSPETAKPIEDKLSETIPRLRAAPASIC